MIYEIYQYGVMKGIVANTTPGYCDQSIHFGLYLNPDGTIMVEPIGGPEGRKFLRVPFLTVEELGMARIKKVVKKGTKAGERGRHFLWDDVGTVTMAGKASEKDLKGLAPRKHEAFVEMLERAAAGGVRDAGRCAEVLRKRLPEVQALVGKAGAKRNCKITFNVDGEWLVERTDWNAWWNSERARINGLRDKSKRLLVSVASHEVVSPEGHLPIKKISGASAQGAKLACFDKPAFQSYGLTNQENSPVSEAEAVGYQTTMNHLVERGVKLPGSTAIFMVNECDPGDDDEAVRLLATLGGGDEQVDADKLRELLEAIEKGKRPKTSNATYTVMVVSAVQARLMVRSFAVGKVTDLLRNVNRWFEDTQSTPDGTPRKLRRFLYSLFCPANPASGSGKKSPDDYVPGHCSVQLFEAAIKGREIPLLFVQKALEKHSSTMLGSDDVRVDVRVLMGIVKAFLIRKGIPMKTSLEVENPSEAYQLGRLFALLEDIQRTALPTVGSSIVDRYYHGMLSNPARCLPILRGLANGHLQKIGRDRPGLSCLLKSQIAKIAERIRSPLPVTMNLTQRAEFLMGFEHAKADILRRIEEARKKKAAAAAAKAAKAAASVSSAIVAPEAEAEVDEMDLAVQGMEEAGGLGVGALEARQ